MTGSTPLAAPRPEADPVPAAPTPPARAEPATSGAEGATGGVQPIRGVLPAVVPAPAARSPAPPAKAQAGPRDEGLGRLDDLIVPRLQARARSVAHTLATPLRALDRLDAWLFGESRLTAVYRRRGAATLLLVAMAFTGTLIHFDRYPEIRDREAAARAAAREQAVRPPGQVGTDGVLAGGAQVVGPSVGTDLGDYLVERRMALAEVPAGERRVAVVSFDEYRTAEQVLAVLPEGTTMHFAQLRIPAEGATPVETEIVGGDLVASVERAVEVPLADLLAEEDRARTMIGSGTVDDEAFLRDLQLYVQELSAVRSLVNSGAGLIFAVVVEARAATLAEVATASGVRIVDVADAETDPANSGFYGLLPEDRDTATYGGPA